MMLMKATPVVSGRKMGGLGHLTEKGVRYTGAVRSGSTDSRTLW